MAKVHNFTEEYVGFWKKSRSSFPSFPHAISRHEKQHRETILDQYTASLKALRGKKAGRKKLSAKEEQLFASRTQNLFRDGLNFTDQQLDVIFSDRMMEITRKFMRQARAFDPSLTINDIFQACRNMWIMNGLQIVLGVPVEVTPSVFAYSLLYPYTDNLLDDPCIASEEKLFFCKKFYRRLKGEAAEPATTTEGIIFSLVAMIETEFSRRTFPEVYESLLAIHEAQARSVQLFHSGDALSEHETLEICIVKGGTSVVADGYLVAGTLNRDQEYFLFGYGAYLQLMDDIQDAAEDRAAGLHTVFSRSEDVLETKLNMTYWFGESVMQNLRLFGTRHVEIITSLMRKSMDLLLIDAVAQNPDLYSKGYVSAMEDYSPFSFAYIQNRKNRSASHNGFLRTAIKEMAFNDSRPSARARTA